MNFGWPEILIVLVIVVLLFGVGRIGKVGSEIGTGDPQFPRRDEWGIKKAQK